VLQLAGVLVERKTISGDDVAEIMGTPSGSRTIHRPQGFIAFDPDGGNGGDVSRYTSIPALPKATTPKKAKAKAKKHRDDFEEGGGD
jgi:hypothetical protein